MKELMWVGEKKNLDKKNVYIEMGNEREIVWK